MANFKKIADYVVTGSSTPDITFNNIPATYETLVIIGSVRGAGFTDWFKMKLNNTGSYDARYIFTDTSNRDSALQSSQSYPLVNPLADSTQLMANLFTSAEIYVPNYSSSSQNKVMICTGGEADEGSHTNARISQWDVVSDRTEAITRIDFEPQHMTGFAVGTTFTIYGLEA